jgi:hypothetical protein
MPRRVSCAVVSWLGYPLGDVTDMKGDEIVAIEGKGRKECWQVMMVNAERKCRCDARQDRSKCCRLFVKRQKRERKQCNIQKKNPPVEQGVIREAGEEED